MRGGVDGRGGGEVEFGRVAQMDGEGRDGCDRVGEVVGCGSGGNWAR